MSDDTMSSSMDPMEVEKRSSDECSPWQYYLPSELVVKVFEYLAKEDRLKARGTCRHWNNTCLAVPRFWDEQSFSIIGQNDSETRRVSGYMRRFGCHLKKLIINLETEKAKRTKIQKQSQRVFSELQILLQANLQLQSFGFHIWDDNRPKNTFIDNPFDRAAVATDLCNLLERQERLIAVDLDNCYMDDDYCWQVFRAIASPNIASTLTSLSLRNFFYYDLLEDFSSVFLEVPGRFKMLIRLALNFRFLHDNVLVELTRASPGLKEIILLAEYIFPEEMIPPSSVPNWQEAAKKRPDLRVWMTMEIEDIEEMPYQQLLLPHMPLISLNMIFPQFDMEFDNDIEMEITEATRFIHPNRLKVFILGWPRSAGHQPWNHPESLVGLVKACPFLTDISLQMTVTLDTLLQIAAAAHPGTEEGEEGGEQSARSPGLQIHVAGCDPVLERKSLARLSNVNPFFTVHVCDGCQKLLDSQPFI